MEQAANCAEETWDPSTVAESKKLLDKSHTTIAQVKLLKIFTTVSDIESMRTETQKILQSLRAKIHPMTEKDVLLKVLQERAQQALLKRVPKESLLIPPAKKSKS